MFKFTVTEETKESKKCEANSKLLVHPWEDSFLRVCDNVRWDVKPDEEDCHQIYVLRRRRNLS